MGKPFEKELEKLDATLHWGQLQNIDDLLDNIVLNCEYPLFVVGSGGSLSACNYLAMQYQTRGIMAKAITPLELFYSGSAIRNSKVLFISSSGRNNDILFAYQTATEFEPKGVYGLCMKLNSPLFQLSKKNSLGQVFEYDLPSGKDGFLATNSLVAFFSIINKAFELDVKQSQVSVNSEVLAAIDKFVDTITPDYTLTVLYGGWGQPVAVDIESKIAEAALANVLVSDIRNFGHGRHHWFDKRKGNSAIIALVTPQEELIVSKTLSYIPNDIPVLILRSTHKNSFSSIDLLIQSFHFIHKLGKSQGIDPGRPGVPEFGSKLYHLKYSGFYKKKNVIPENESIAIVRKSGTPVFENLSTNEKEYWRQAYTDFKSALCSTEFGIVIFDYDGTLCSGKNRFNGIDDNIIKHLLRILEQNIIVGIATGRGKSVREALQASIPRKHWEKIVLGYYNCSDIGTLSANELPDRSRPVKKSLDTLFQTLSAFDFGISFKAELRPNQITIEISDKRDWVKVRPRVINFVLNQNIQGIQIVESSHSLDIIDADTTSKPFIKQKCEELALASQLSSESLCIGDKGVWPGNDYLLLANWNALSVDEVSPLKDSAWNFAPVGIKNIDATNVYLSWFSFSKNGFFLKVP